ncbi:MAG TPA: 3-oxoadipate enol-lactonase [Kofleriaceae bacterium]|jgi:3-oxoadipate enol-lactonase/4-carboxymuconolactone decarboxylase
MSRFLDARGIATHLAIDGPPGAPAILLVHSLGSSLRIWDAQVEALARGFRVVRYDLRGHGLTEVADGPCTVEDLADDALAVLDACGVAAAHVAGVSIGGMVAQAIAARAPARVRSLILCDTAMAIPPPEMWRQRAALVRAEGVAAIADSVLPRWVSPAYLASPAGRGLHNLLVRTPAPGYAALADALAVADLSRTTPQIRVPTLIVVGELDPSTTVAAAEAMRDAIAGAQLVVIPGALHVPMLDHPDEVTAAILGFLTPRDAGLAAAGARVRAEVLGPDHVARAAAAATDLDRDFQAYLTHAAWGGVWARPHLDRRTRSIITVALLAALGREHELALHIRAMRRTGASASDLTELMLHVAVYAGVPAANAALRIAKQVAEESP